MSSPSRNRRARGMALLALVALGACREAPAPAPAVPALPPAVRPMMPAAMKAPAGQRVLRVCADPNNLPFTNRRGEGFENRIADLLGRELGARVAYTWWAQRRGFVRNTLRANTCDVILGVPSAFELAATTAPYYRSTYVFVTRRDRGLVVRSFDDPALRRVRVGVQLIGDDGANAPPAHALAARGIVQNVVGYTVYGDYRDETPPARILDALSRVDN